jgi:hypothetical protein
MKLNFTKIFCDIHCFSTDPWDTSDFGLRTSDFKLFPLSLHPKAIHPELQASNLNNFGLRISDFGLDL